MTADRNTTTAVDSPSERQLWFGLVGALFCWVCAGLLNVLFAWQACMGGEAGSFVFTSTGMEILLGFITFGLLAVGIWAGMVSYRNWQRLTHGTDVFHGEGFERKQYMAICGVIVTVTLGVGMMWFSVPIYVLQICTRWR